MRNVYTGGLKDGNGILTYFNIKIQNKECKSKENYGFYCKIKYVKKINNEKYRYYGNNHHQLVKSFKRGLMQIEIQQTHSVPPKVKWKDMNIS